MVLGIVPGLLRAHTTHLIKFNTGLTPGMFTQTPMTTREMQYFREACDDRH